MPTIKYITSHKYIFVNRKTGKLHIQFYHFELNQKQIKLIENCNNYSLLRVEQQKKEANLYYNYKI